MTPAEVIEKLRHCKLLTIQDYPYLQPIDGQGGWAKLAASPPPDEYDRTYFGVLKESLGVTAEVVKAVEWYAEIDKVPPQRAEQTADAWIAEAEEVTKVTRSDIVRSASLYWACEALLEKYEADAITISSWELIPDGKLKAMPPLAEMEMAKTLVPCCCESLIDCLVSQMIGTYLSGRPGFVGDQVSNWTGLRREDAVRPLPENYVAVGHCYGPINPHGDDRVPYAIRDHAYYELQWGNTDEPRASWRAEDYLRVNRQMKQQQVTLAAIRVDWPTQEPVTLAKVDPYNKKAQVSAGISFDPHPFFAEFDNTVCRAKLAIETDTPFTNRVGGHLVAFFGDLKGEFETFSRLAGFELME
jgi:L-fucose isomerase-like protein